MFVQLALAAMFQNAVRVAGVALNEQPHKRNALDTLVVLLRAILTKGLTGWEIMNTLGGGASEADSILSVGASELRATHAEIAIVHAELCGHAQRYYGE